MNLEGKKTESLMEKKVARESSIRQTSEASPRYTRVTNMNMELKNSEFEVEEVDFSTNVQ